MVFEVGTDAKILKFLNVDPEVFFWVYFWDCEALFHGLLCQLFEVRLLAGLMVIHALDLTKYTHLLWVVCN